MEFGKSSRIIAAGGSLALGLVLGLVLGLAAPPAQAQAVHRIVQTRDLLLSSPQGVRTLNRRVSRAARHVCGEAVGDDIYFVAARRTCVRAAIAAAQPQILYAIQRDRLLPDPGTTRLARR